MSVYTRIKQIRTDKRLSQEKFAGALGLSRSQIASIETNKSSVTSRTINDICREFNVNKEWLVSGIGDIYSIQNEIDEITTTLLSIASDPNSFKCKAILSLANLSDEEWKLLLKISETIQKKTF